MHALISFIFTLEWRHQYNTVSPLFADYYFQSPSFSSSMRRKKLEGSGYEIDHWTITHLLSYSLILSHLLAH